MKKILSLLLAFLMTASCTAFASQKESRLSTEVKLDVAANTLIVSGKVEADKSRVPLVLVIKDGGDIVWGDQTETAAPEEGFSDYAFEPYVIPKDKASTVFTVTVSAQFIGETNSIEYSYGGIDKKYAVLAEIVKYDKSASASSMRTNVIEAYTDTVGITADSYNSLSSAAKDILAKVVSAGEYTCPEGYVSSEDTAQIDTQIMRFALALREAEVIARLADAGSKEKLAAWVSDYAEQYNFTKDDPLTADDEGKLYSEYFVKIEKTGELINRIKSAASAALSFAELKELIFDKVLLTYIETGNYTTAKQMVSDFGEKFKSIDASKRVNDVYMGVTGKYYETIKAFCDACNDFAVSEQKGGSGGGTGGGRSSSVTVEYPSALPGQDTGISGFTDMENHAWAKEAVIYLRDKGIISGRTSAKFAPSDNITRAEFAKILVNAAGIRTAEYNGEFEDVKASDWYAPFVAAASREGIILGSDGRFMPNRNITRQDMAVMIKRTLKLEDSGYIAVFDDSESISDYAKEAVYAVYINGVMKGSGDGYFNPSSNATRAEAAQTVYNMLTKNR